MPYILYPIWRPFEEDRGKPLLERYIVKANVWIAIFSFVGNYVWTHYFYSVLKAKYTFDAHRLNDVPISMFLMTHAYFMFYHAMTNSILRKIKTSYEKDVYRDVFYMVVVIMHTLFFHLRNLFRLLSGWRYKKASIGWPASVG